MTERGEIYWVDFGLPLGSEPGFRRPALVVQDDVANDAGRTTIVAALSTRVPSRPIPFVITLEAGEAGLKERSVIRLDQLRTVDLQRLEERAGRIPNNRMLDVDAALCAILHLQAEGT